MVCDPNIARWQQRLEQAFRGSTGIVGERLSHVLHAEDSYFPQVIAGSHGFTALMDSFQDFYVQTYEEMSDHAFVKNINVCSIVVASFYRLRYALQGFYRGYPHDAAASIRPLFENAFFLCAVLNGVVEHDALFGYSKGLGKMPNTARDLAKIQRKYLQEMDLKIRTHVRGDGSGLAKADQDAVTEILQLQHSHVHRTESSIIHLIGDMVQFNKLPPLHPEYSDQRSNHFATMMVYGSWLLLRVIPFISYPQAYSAQWHEKYQLLDESFEFYIRQTKGGGYEAFCRMVQAKFYFDTEVAWTRVKVESGKTNEGRQKNASN